MTERTEQAMRELLDQLDSQCGEILDQLKPVTARKAAIQGFVNVIWFVLPGLAMWSFGADPVTAARYAVGPYLCVLSLTLMLSAAGAAFIYSRVETIRAGTEKARTLQGWKR